MDNAKRMVDAALAALKDHGATRGNVTNCAEMDALAAALEASNESMLSEAWSEAFYKVDRAKLRKFISNAYTGDHAHKTQFALHVLDAIMDAYEYVIEAAEERLPTAIDLGSDDKTDAQIKEALYG